MVGRVGQPVRLVELLDRDLVDRWAVLEGHISGTRFPSTLHHILDHLFEGTSTMPVRYDDTVIFDTHKK